MNYVRGKKHNSNLPIWGFMKALFWTTVAPAEETRKCRLSLSAYRMPLTGDVNGTVLGPENIDHSINS